MRILTPSEQREIEAIKKQVFNMWGDDVIKIPITMDDREKWLNILDMVLQTQDAMRVAWGKSDNPVINLRG